MPRRFAVIHPPGSFPGISSHDGATVIAARCRQETDDVVEDASFVITIERSEQARRSLAAPRVSGKGPA
ncbi:MAG TPA: hypothetical protein VLK65_28655 [Vicinamibacteria bacterium]|nr:hypothetical protein [Vicinamibacteria bacterium]